MEKILFTILLVSFVLAGCAEPAPVQDLPEAMPAVEDLPAPGAGEDIPAPEEPVIDDSQVVVEQPDDTVEPAPEDTAEMQLLAGVAPTEIYREYTFKMGGSDWRVTDPDAENPRAQNNLPNAVLHMDIKDLEGAVRAEALIERWGGHVGTSKKRIRFNSNPWIRLPELTTTPSGHEPECYLFQDNPVVEIPLDYLQAGDNTFEATADRQICHGFKWGQWGWYAINLRVYFDANKPHPKGKILSPGMSLGENPTVEVLAHSEAGIERIDLYAYYEGYDENGDGIYQDWHGGYFTPKESTAVALSGHVGTATQSPYKITWDTTWVPDQLGDLKLVARIKDKSGMWSVTAPVEHLGLSRRNSQVVLYKAEGLDEKFLVRDGQTKSLTISIPDDLSRATQAVIHLRTWHGDDHAHGGTPLTINDWKTSVGGTNHRYKYTVVPVPVSVLKTGKNAITFHSPTEGHGLEVLWPGPGITVRYAR